MPPLTDPRAVAALTGPDKSIVPDQPEQSRFFTVVMLSEQQIGALPPTGYALTRRGFAALLTWIREGARVPWVTTKLVPERVGPRSR